MNDFRRYLTPLTTRKPESWAVCPLRRNLTVWHHDMLRQLPVVETTAQPFEDFLGDLPPRECVVRVGERHFYVNPEGYSYARYAFQFEPQVRGLGEQKNTFLRKNLLASVPNSAIMSKNFPEDTTHDLFSETQTANRNDR